MRINKIHIENFGKLSNVTLNLNEGLNEIYQENGFGKTTLSIFLKAMFYGMPAGRENLKMERKKYFPWQGGNFGGFIEYTTDKGKFRLTRFFGKTPESDTFELLDLNSNTILDRLKIEIGEEIFEVGKETFEMTAFFPQNNIMINANNQMSANILGLDKFKFDLANVGIAIDNLKKKEAEIKKQKSNKDVLLNKKNRLLTLKNEMTELQTSLDNIQEEIDKLKLEIAQKEEELVSLEKQKHLQDELNKVKESIEKEILSISGEINNLYLMQEKNNQIRQNLSPQKFQNNKNFQISVVLLALLFLLIPIFLMVFDVIELYLAFILIGGIVLVAILLLLLVGKNKKENNNKNNEYEDLLNQQEDISKNITLKREMLKNAEVRLESYKNINTNNDFYYESKEKLTAYKLQIDRKCLLKENYQKEIDNLIDNIDNLKDEINNCEILDKEIEKKISILSKTREFLSQAHQNVSKRFIEPVNKAIGDIIEKFDLRDREFIVDTNFDIKQNTLNGIKELDYSSQGIKDVLSFCMRTYFIGEIFKNEKPFIVLDDTFVNLDDENLKRVSLILEVLSKEYQIIYSYCHSRCKIKNS